MSKLKTYVIIHRFWKFLYLTKSVNIFPFLPLKLYWYCLWSPIARGTCVSGSERNIYSPKRFQSFAEIHIHVTYTYMHTDYVYRLRHEKKCYIFFLSTSPLSQIEAVLCFNSQRRKCFNDGCRSCRSRSGLLHHDLIPGKQMGFDLRWIHMTSLISQRILNRLKFKMETSRRILLPITWKLSDSLQKRT